MCEHDIWLEKYVCSLRGLWTFVDETATTTTTKTMKAAAAAATVAAAKHQNREKRTTCRLKTWLCLRSVLFSFSLLSFFFFSFFFGSCRNSYYSNNVTCLHAYEWILRFNKLLHRRLAAQTQHIRSAVLMVQMSWHAIPVRLMLSASGVDVWWNNVWTLNHACEYHGVCWLTWRCDVRILNLISANRINRYNEI